MSSYVPVALRQQVISRARGHCEYCLFPQEMAFLSFEIEHVIAEKHGGATEEANLALACPECNRFKGTDLGSLDAMTGRLTPFFNPRTQRWTEHFRYEAGQIIPLSAEARVTIAILRFNTPTQVNERQLLEQSGNYPPNLEE